MDQGRRIQLDIWRTMGVHARMELAQRMTDEVIRQRDRRLQRQHPGIDNDGMRRARIADCLALAKLSSAP